MWALDNRTPYAAERNWIRDKQGRHHWVVAVKATFDISASGKLSLADEQAPPALAPEYRDKPGESSLRWDSDLLYAKPCTDVIAEAHAYAPKGRPTGTVEVSVRVGSIHKQLRVHGERLYYKGVTALAMTPPVPFVSRPIIYEDAFGGVDSADPDPAKHRIDDRNPIGKGFAVDLERLVHQPAHTIEYPGKNPATSSPAGFGPLDPAWSPRRQRAGTYDAHWAQKKKPLLPDDYDDLFGSTAPDDQRPEHHLRGGEPVELQGLDPSGLLRFTLPKIYLTYSTRFGARREEHRGRLVTVLLMPSSLRIALVWQTTLYVAPRDDEYLDVTVIDEKPYVR